MAGKGVSARVLIFVSLIAVSLAVAVFVGLTAYGEQLNQYAGDWLFRLRGVEKAGTERVAIVAIDEDSISLYGWPLDRAVLGRALARICAGRPTAVGMDLLFTDPTNPESDQALAAALQACPQTVLAARLAKENISSLEADHWADPLAEFAERVAAVAHVHTDPDLDGFSRRSVLAKTAGQKRRWTLALEVFRVHSGHRGPVLEDEHGLTIGSRYIPAPRDRAAAAYAMVNEGGRSQRILAINYAGPEGTFPRYTLQQVVESERPESFAGRPVLIGVTAQSVGVTDRKFTPFSTAGRDMPGVEIHANILRTLMSGRFLTPMPESTRLAWMAAIAAAAGVLLFIARGLWLGLALGVVAVAVHALPYFLFMRSLTVAPAFSFSLAIWTPLVVGGIFQYATVWRHYVAADASSRRMRSRLEMVSHEMRTPLTAIQGSSELMSRYPLNEERRKQLAELIQRESQRLSRMVERFLDVERLEAGEMELRREHVPLSPLVDRTLERIQPLLMRKHIQVRKNVAAEPQTLGDSELLEFALYNLVSNAVKYSPEKSTVEVTVRSNASAGLAYLDVADQGVGIAPEDQARIFDRFFRSDAAQRSGQPGLGLGLSIVREIARHHGGSVLLESKPGQGSRFSLALPLVNGR